MSSPGIFSDVQAYVRGLNACTKIEHVADLADQMTRLIGFRYYAFSHHVDVRLPTVDDYAPFSLNNYPEAWLERVVYLKSYADDPIHVACAHSLVPFRWDKLTEVISLKAAQQAVLDEASRAGLHQGVTSPIHLPGYISGSASFASDRAIDLSDEILPVAHCIGAFSFEALRRLRNTPSRQPVQFTGRMLDVIRWLSRGKSDTDMATILGLSRHTVNDYVEEAKRRVGVASRRELAIHALYSGHVTFADLMADS